MTCLLCVARDNDKKQSKSKGVVQRNRKFIAFYDTRDKCKKVMMVVSMVTTPVIFAVFLTWLYLDKKTFVASCTYHVFLTHRPSVWTMG